MLLRRTNNFAQSAAKIHERYQDYTRMPFYSLNIHSADEMIKGRRGNCFTVTEATARDLDQLYLTKLTLIAICQNLNYHTGRYNTHGFSVGVPEHAEDALKLDNIAHSPQAFDVDGIITDGLRAATDYVYRWQERGEEQRTGQSVAIGDRFVWPEDSYRHEVFMPLQAGIVAIHHIFALDEAKAIHPSEFIIAKQGMPALPTLPKREVLSAS